MTTSVVSQALRSYCVMQLACLCLDLCIIKLQKKWVQFSLYLQMGSNTGFKGLSILCGQQRGRFTSIAFGSITLDFRGYVES